VLVAAGTATSRVTGLLRTVVLAGVLGTTVLADAYNLANTTPNIVYDLLLGGVLSATLVPVFVDRLEHDDERGVSAVMTMGTLALVVLTALAVLAAPVIYDLYAVQVPDELAADQRAVAIPLLRLFLPQVLFYGLTALAIALLNARRRFAAAAFAPVVNNLVVIVVLLAVPVLADGQPTADQVVDDSALLWLLGAGTTLGIVAMAAVLWPALRRSGSHVRWNPDWRDPAVSKVLRMSGWTFGYVIGNQLALFVLLVLMNGTDEGAVSAYTYAWLFFQLPYGLFAVSISTTFTPELASAASAGDLPAFRARFEQGLRLILFVLLPSAVGLALLARPVVSVLLEREAFGAASVSTTADVLVLLALALPFFATYLFAIRGFTAFKDTRTPFLLNVGYNVTVVVGALVLVGPFELRGVIGALAAGYVLAASAALVVLSRRVGGLDAAKTVPAVARQVGAAAAMAVVVVAVAAVVGDDRGVGAVARLVVAGLAGLATYGGVLAATGSDEMRWVLARVRRRGAGPDPAVMP
jgi:putative peptidoglycan lipid II flippase